MADNLSFQDAFIKTLNEKEILILEKISDKEQENFKLNSQFLSNILKEWEKDYKKNAPQIKHIVKRKINYVTDTIERKKHTTQDWSNVDKKLYEELKFQIPILLKIISKLETIERKNKIQKKIGINVNDIRPKDNLAIEELKKELEQIKIDNKTLNIELAQRNDKIKELKKKRRFNNVPEKEELEKIVVKHLKKNGTINYKKLGDYLGVSDKTAKNWCEHRRINNFRS